MHLAHHVKQGIRREPRKPDKPREDEEDLLIFLSCQNKVFLILSTKLTCQPSKLCEPGEAGNQEATQNLGLPLH